MALKQRLFGLVAGVLFERPAGKLTLDALAARLAAGGGTVEARAAAAADTPANRRQLAHIIGIERWGQRRLRTLLGEPLVRDESDVYQPGEDLALDDLRAAFRATREGTVALASELIRAGVPRERTVPHNDFGPLSLGGWLLYLTQHATRESTRLRPAERAGAGDRPGARA